MRIILKLVILIIAMALPTFVCASATIGQLVPELVARDLSGKTIDLSANHGKVVLVHFWATWCPSCRAEMPVLDKFYLEHRNSGLEVIGISLDRSSQRDAVTQAMKDLHFQSALISDVETNGFGRPRVLPVTYIIDRNGILSAQLLPDDDETLTDVTLNKTAGNLLNHQ